ncbi:MAG TPA: glycosyl transferase [Fibrobacteraceae bacterium]|nr:glycosyl transferase [Fibrobacteraceae bacterium]
MSKYGYFDDAKKEYVVTNPATPIKWCNYVGTLKFGGIVDTTGGTLVCKGDPALNRITKYLSWMPNSEFKGSTVYIRIRKGRKYIIFSPFVTPTLTQLDKWECHVGLSYSRWIAEYAGLRIQITVFVPTGSNTLLQDIQVTNIQGAAQTVDVIPVYEFSHFDALKHLTNADWVPQTMTLKAHPEKTGHVVLEQYAFMKRDFCVNYVTCDKPVTSFEGDRRVFLGANEMGSFAHPLALDKGKLSNSECLRGDNIAALMVSAGSLKKGQTFRTCTQLGQEHDLSVAQPTIKKYRSLKNVDVAFKELANFWKDYLQAIQVQTPDASFNSMVNVHNPRQCHTTKNWSRYLSLYQLGYGSDRGIGYRDSSQDLLGVMSHMPEEARELAENLLSVQKREGSAMHQYFPSTMEANEGDSREKEDRPKYYGDDHLWIVLTVASYLKETGNLKFLNKKIPFYDKDKHTGKALESGTVWEHVCRSLRFTWKDRGQHGLPHLGFADWNDTVNLPKGAESMFNANLFGKALKEAIDVANAAGKTAEAAEFQKYYDEMKKAVNSVAWDGKWWKRWFDHEGKPIGSNENKYGKLYTNGQSWPVMSGFAEGERALTAMNSVNKHMNTRNGVKLSWPGYNGFDPTLGGVSTYPPGAKENGGIFLHANPWVMIAETILGRGELAFQYYNQINPAAKNEILDEFESEPYCYPQNILGDEHKQFGLGRNAWLSGTSSWTYQAATQWILGVRASFKGLIVDPCIPKEWKGFKVTRKWRGATYQITVKNTGKVCKGVKSMTVDGKVVQGNAAPVFKSGVHKVEVELG